MKFFIKDFFSKCDQIRSFMWIWSHLPKKSLMENFIFCAKNFLCSGSLAKINKCLLWRYVVCYTYKLYAFGIGVWRSVNWLWKWFFFWKSFPDLDDLDINDFFYNHLLWLVSFSLALTHFWVILVTQIAFFFVNKANKILTEICDYVWTLLVFNN